LCYESSVTRRHILWIGLSLYVVSFFLVAVTVWSPSLGILRGYECALNTLLGPWTEEARSDGWARFKDFEKVCTLVAGWINPVFLLALIAGWIGRPRRLASILRIVVLAMIPFCWAIFRYESLYPREGHFVWIAGMLIALFSTQLARTKAA
jgi:hypothetical protein